jgi:hypothetical protein
MNGCIAMKMTHQNGSGELLGMVRRGQEKNPSQLTNPAETTSINDPAGMKQREILSILADPDNVWHQFIMGM